MASIYPFRARMPRPDVASRVAAVPYDVVSREEAANLAAGNPLSFLHVSRPEIDLPAEIGASEDEVYDLARKNFENLCEAAPLIDDDAETYYVYRINVDDHSQTGIAAAVSVDDYDNDIVKKHEKTRPDKEDDRTRHAHTLRAHTGPVFLTYLAVAAIDNAVSQVTQDSPLMDVTAEDGVRHEVWRSPPDTVAVLRNALADVPSVYVADGHHRAKSASRVCAMCRAEGETGANAGCGRFLAVLFPSDQVRVLAYNRQVLDLNGYSAAEVLDLVGERFDIVPTAANIPIARGSFCMYLGGQWYSVSVCDRTTDLTASPIARLDVSVLQDNILSPILGIDDVRTSRRIEFVGGIRGAGVLQDAVDAGRAAVAFSMYPVGIQELIDIADAGEIMPPKSTWFEPKLRDGLLSYCF